MYDNDFYDDLAGALERSWRLLEEAIDDATSPVRTPVLISVSTDGLAQGCTVVLRGINRQRRQLQIYTDVRSAKVAQLRAQPACTLVAYQPNPMMQLRLGSVVHRRSMSPCRCQPMLRAEPVVHRYMCAVSANLIIPPGDQTAMNREQNW